MSRIYVVTFFDGSWTKVESDDCIMAASNAVTEMYGEWATLVPDARLNAKRLCESIRMRFDRILTATIHRPSRFNENALQVSDEDNAPDVYTVEALSYQPEQEAGLTPYELDNMRNYWPRLTLDAMRERVCMCVKQDDYIRVRNERTQRTVKVKTVLALDLAMYFHKFA